MYQMKLLMLFITNIVVNYENLSPLITEELADKFIKGHLHKLEYYKVTKYKVTMLDETNYEKFTWYSEAKEYITTKCKDKSTIAGKLIYSEFDACITNNNIEEYEDTEKLYTGTKIELSYGEKLVDYYDEDEVF